jgi:hypothetical protein
VVVVVLLVDAAAPSSFLSSAVALAETSAPVPAVASVVVEVEPLAEGSLVAVPLDDSWPEARVASGAWPAAVVAVRLASWGAVWAVAPAVAPVVVVAVELVPLVVWAAAGTARAKAPVMAVAMAIVRMNYSSEAPEAGRALFQPQARSPLR